MNVDTSRAAAAIVLVVLVYALVVGVATTTPWRVVPDVQRRPPWQQDFTADERKREVRYHREIRPPAYARMALGLVITLVLGFTPLGARLVEWVATPAGDGWAWAVLLGGWRCCSWATTHAATVGLERDRAASVGALDTDVGKLGGRSREGLRRLPRADAGAAAGLLLAGPGASASWWIWAGAGAAAFVVLVSLRIRW